MGIFSFLPQFDRCCLCTRNLKVASIFIVFWSMLACSHTMSLLLWPTCPGLHDKANEHMSFHLIVLKWILFAVNLFLILSSFAFLIGIFKSFSVTGDVFVGLGFVYTFFSIFYGICALLQLPYTGCAFNANDTLILFIYCACWVYFLLVVNSYVMTM